MQNALWSLGGVPEPHCSDSLSAALRDLGADAKEDLTTRDEAFCGHYGIMPTRNNPSVSQYDAIMTSLAYAYESAISQFPVFAAPPPKWQNRLQHPGPGLARRPGYDPNQSV